MRGISTEVKVGIFVLVGFAVLAYMTFRLGKLQFGEPAGYTIWAVFDNATGLKKGAPVEVAGIHVGKVAAIQLYQGKARVNLLIRHDVKLPSDSRAIIRTRGVLGDKYVGIEPGTPQAPALKNGQKLVRAQVPTDLDEIMARLGSIAQDVKALTSSLRVSVGSPESQQNIKESLANIREITAALKEVVANNRNRLDQVISNLENFTGDLAQISRENKQALKETIQNFRTVSTQLDHTIGALTSVAEKIDQGEGTLGALVNERQTLDDLNATLASLKEITHKIEKGEGSIGKLVNDDTTVNKIDEALTGINNYLNQADRWHMAMEYRAEYMFKSSTLRNTVNLRLQPKADKFYLIGIVSDPLGRLSEKVTTRTIINPDGSEQVVEEKLVTEDRDEILFNAQIGKRFYDFTVRAGLFSSTGGLGLDYHLLDDKLRFTFEAYDFRKDYNAHLKLALDYSFWKYFYITAGWDDFISDDSERSSLFLGGGFTFFDDDFRFLMSNAPRP